MTKPIVNAFNWRVRPPVEPEKAEPSYPQKDYYHRKKLGLTGTRQNPDRQWRKRADEQQYQRDLETLSRIEKQRECFFDAMGEIHADQIQTSEAHLGIAA